MYHCELQPLLGIICKLNLGPTGLRVLGLRTWHSESEQCRWPQAFAAWQQHTVSHITLCVCLLGWLFGTSSNKKKKKAKSSSYVDPAEKAQALKEGRAVDLAALLELKQLIHHNPDSFFSTWEEDGNPCNFAKVPQASLHMWHALHQHQSYELHVWSCSTWRHMPPSCCVTQLNHMSRCMWENHKGSVRPCTSDLHGDAIWCANPYVALLCQMRHRVSSVPSKEGCKSML